MNRIEAGLANKRGNKKRGQGGDSDLSFLWKLPTDSCFVQQNQKEKIAVQIKVVMEMFSKTTSMLIQRLTIMVVYSIMKKLGKLIYCLIQL